MPVTIAAPDQAMCDYLEPVESNVLVVQDGEAGSLDFTCAATSGMAKTISIDCGSGDQVFTDHDVDHLTATCDYEGL